MATQTDAELKALAVARRTGRETFVVYDGQSDGAYAERLGVGGYQVASAEDLETWYAGAVVVGCVGADGVWEC